MWKFLTSFTSLTKPANLSPVVPQPTRQRKQKREENNFVSYYGRPVIKKPHWVWPIWVYFWVGGIWSGVSVLGTLLQIFGDKKRDASLLRSAHWLSLAGAGISPMLLILDLQRPERFLHMLRVLKLSSPISVGTYIMTGTAGLSGLNAASWLAQEGWLPRNSFPAKLAGLIPYRLTGAAQGIGGLGLGSYTGVLLTATAVPLWAEMKLVLPPLFMASAFSTGAAALTLGQLLHGESATQLHRLEATETAALLTELGLLGYTLVTLPPAVRQPALAGRNKFYFGLAVGLGQIAPLFLKTFAPTSLKNANWFNLIQASWVLIGGFFLRVAIVEAGKTTADSAAAYHAITGGNSPDSQSSQSQN